MELPDYDSGLGLYGIIDAMSQLLGVPSHELQACLRDYPPGISGQAGKATLVRSLQTSGSVADFVADLLVCGVGLHVEIEARQR